jgi:hypothetical protein
MLYSLCVPPHLTVCASPTLPPSLLPSSFLVAQAQPSSRVTSSWLGLALIIGQDVEGNWHTDTIAAATDNVCTATIMSVVGIIKVSVHYDISYFTPAKLHVCTHHTTTSLPTTVFSQVSFHFHSLPLGMPKEIIISTLFPSPLLEYGVCLVGCQTPALVPWSQVGLVWLAIRRLGPGFERPHICPWHKKTLAATIFLEPSLAQPRPCTILWARVPWAGHQKCSVTARWIFLATIHSLPSTVLVSLALSPFRRRPPRCATGGSELHWRCW